MRKPRIYLSKHVREDRAKQHTEIIEGEQRIISFTSTRTKKCPNCNMTIKPDYLIHVKDKWKCAFCLNTEEWEKYWENK